MRASHADRAVAGREDEVENIMLGNRLGSIRVPWHAVPVHRATRVVQMDMYRRGVDLWCGRYIHDIEGGDDILNRLSRMERITWENGS